MVNDFRRVMLLRTMRLLDLVVLCTAFLAALANSSDSLRWAAFREVLLIRIALINFLLLVAYLAMCSAVFSACGLYGSHRLSCWTRRLKETLLSVTVITGVLLAVRWPLHFAFATNTFLLVFWCLNVGGLSIAREVIHFGLRFIRLRGRNLRNVVIVGEEPNATALAQRLQEEVGLGYRILQVIDAGEITKWSNRN